MKCIDTGVASWSSIVTRSLGVRNTTNWNWNHYAGASARIAGARGETVIINVIMDNLGAPTSEWQCEITRENNDYFIPFNFILNLLYVYVTSGIFQLHLNSNNQPTNQHHQEQALAASIHNLEWSCPASQWCGNWRKFWSIAKNVAFTLWNLSQFWNRRDAWVDEGIVFLRTWSWCWDHRATWVWWKNCVSGNLESILGS